MWINAVLLVSSFAGIPDMEAVASSPDCIVIGKVFKGSGTISARLFSNCPLAVEGKTTSLVMTGRHRRVEFMMPSAPGVHDFVYRWGQTTAQLDDKDIAISFGPAGDT